MVSQTTGINTVTLFGAALFDDIFDSEHSAAWGVLIITGTMVVMGFPTIFYLHRINRKIWYLAVTSLNALMLIFFIFADIVE